MFVIKDEDGLFAHADDFYNGWSWVKLRVDDTPETAPYIWDSLENAQKSLLTIDNPMAKVYKLVLEPV